MKQWINNKEHFFFSGKEAELLPWKDQQDWKKPHMMQYWFNPILSFYFVQCPWLVFRGNWTSKRSNLGSRENLIIATNFSNQSHQKTSDDDDDQIQFDEHWSSSVFGEEIQGKSRKRLNTGCTFHDCLFFSSLGNESSNVDDDKEEEEKKGERSQETKSHSLRQKKQHTREIKRQNNLKAVLSGGSRLSLLSLFFDFGPNWLLVLHFFFFIWLLLWLLFSILLLLSIIIVILLSHEQNNNYISLRVCLSLSLFKYVFPHLLSSDQRKESGKLPRMEGDG